jgi:hypothetical protein
MAIGHHRDMWPDFWMIGHVDKLLQGASLDLLRREPCLDRNWQLRVVNEGKHGASSSIRMRIMLQLTITYFPIRCQNSPVTPSPGGLCHEGNSAGYPAFEVSFRKRSYFDSKPVRIHDDSRHHDVW